MLITVPLGGSPFTLLYFFTFHTSHSGTASSSLLFSSIFGHSHFLCSSSPHLKYLTLPSTFSCLFTSLTPHCITWLFNTLNLFWGFAFFISSFLLLYFWARCPNLPYHLHNLLSLPSNSTLNLTKARLSLSMSLMSLLYWSRDIVLCFGQVLYIKKDIFLEGLIVFFSYLTYMFAGVQDLHLARYLLPYWLLP